MFLFCRIPGGELGGMVQIKQEKPDTNLMATDPLIASGGPAGSGEGLSASLRFGKTVPGGTGASESKVSKNKPQPSINIRSFPFNHQPRVCSCVPGRIPLVYSVPFFDFDFWSKGIQWCFGSVHGRRGIFRLCQLPRIIFSKF